MDLSDKNRIRDARLRYFEYEHLPPKLAATSRPFYELAEEMTCQLPDSDQLALGLQKLLEAKDCFVRAALSPAS